MNLLRGKISITSWENKSNFPSNSCIQTNVLTNPNVGNTLSKNFFYACSICEGSLIPTAVCEICKRTSIRKCVKCNHVCAMSNHESCRFLISFGKEIIQKHRKELNK